MSYITQRKENHADNLQEKSLTEMRPGGSDMGSWSIDAFDWINYLCNNVNIFTRPNMQKVITDKRTTKKFLEEKEKSAIQLIKTYDSKETQVYISKINKEQQCNITEPVIKRLTVKGNVEVIESVARLYCPNITLIQKITIYEELCKTLVKDLKRTILELSGNLNNHKNIENIEEFDRYIGGKEILILDEVKSRDKDVDGSTNRSADSCKKLDNALSAKEVNNKEIKLFEMQHLSQETTEALRRSASDIEFSGEEFDYDEDSVTDFDFDSISIFYDE